MKPSFALNFAEDRIDLLHRASGGWLEIGTVPLDEPDIGAALNYLRGSALGLEPRGITTKLVIPNSQILYTSILAPGPDAASRRAQIKAGLEGRTPYAVEDLVFDWSGTGATVQVAVIARETLDEAEAFARDHRFNPVSFVAVPLAGQFASEPWFGTTTFAETILAPDEKVERDQDPIKIVMRSPSQPEPAVLPDGEQIYESADQVSTPNSAFPVVADPVANALDAPQEAGNGAALGDLDKPVDLKPVAEDATSAVAVSSPVIPVDETGPKPAEVAIAPGTDVRTPLVADAAVGRAPAPPAMNGKPPGTPLRATGRATGRTAEVPLAFASRRASQNEGNGADQAASAEVPHTAALETKHDPVSSDARAETSSARPEVRSAAARVTAPAIALPKDRRFPHAAPAGRDAVRPNGPSPDTKHPVPVDASALGGRKQAQRGKPRYLGLILTGILLALLALVAAWSSTFVASYFTDDAPAFAISDNPDDPATGDQLAEPTPDDEMLADQQYPEELVDPEALEQPTPESTVAVVQPEPVAEVLPTSPVEAAATVTEAGRNPSNEPQDEIFLADIDPTPETEDAIAIAEPIAPPDPLPPAQVTPPPFGTLYTFDADGQIEPTPEGIITPEGVRLVAGRPARTPPDRPEAPTVATNVTAAPDSVDVAAAPVFASDPALADARPKLRPENLILPATANDDGAALTEEVTTRLGSLRPKARPAEAFAETTPETTTDEAALDAAVQAASASIVASAEASSPSSSLAVAVSRKPAPRPALPDKAVNDAVEAAVAAASSPAEPEPLPAAEPTLALAPQAEDPPASSEPIDEPEVTASAPDIPTRANVAKQATYRNAFNLSKTNLIGVYGTSANRYALVRQPNGRFVKIEVGDRIDGGKVAAISEREVKYVKNGKTLTLSMPKG